MTGRAEYLYVVLVQRKMRWEVESGRSSSVSVTRSKHLHLSSYLNPHASLLF